MTALRETHTSTVGSDEIDHLGHMNVRYYAVRAQHGTDAVVADLPGFERRSVHDIYTRHHREQLEGTPLVVRSGLLGAGPSGVRIHHELAAVDTGTLAATFVHVVSPTDADGTRLPVPDEVVAKVRDEAVELPGYAATRTISLDADPRSSAPTLDEARERGLAKRHERTVGADECDENGNYRLEAAPMLIWAGTPIEERPEELFHETSRGELMAWTTMETRVQTNRLPGVGARIQAFGASLQMFDKAMHRIQWAFDVDSGDLLVTFEVVTMAFDLRQRSPMSIPKGYRRIEEPRLSPDLQPRIPG